MEQRSLRYSNKQLSYTVSGSGLPLLLLHGFAEDSDIWHNQVPALEPLCRLIIPDIPGSGASEMLPGAGIHDYAAAMHALLEKEGRPAVVMGHSMGGYIALALAEHYPDSVSALGMIHSTAYADSPERKEMRLKAMDFIRSKGAFPFLKNSTPGMFSTAAQENLRTQIQQLTERNRAFTAESLCAYYQAMLERPDRTAILKNFPGPVLMVIGALDQAVPFEASLAQCHLPARSHVHILRASAHMGMWEQADELNQILTRFISSLDTASDFNKNKGGAAIAVHPFAPAGHQIVSIFKFSDEKNSARTFPDAHLPGPQCHTHCGR